MKCTRLSFLPLLLLAFLLGACNEDEQTSLKSLTVTETTGSGEERVTTEQQFIYTDEKLTQHITTQTYTDRWLEAQYTHTVSVRISYEPGKVIVTDETGTISTYVINEYGYAESCTRNEPGSNIRTYIFSYSASGSGNLTGIKENINGKPYSEISITILNDGTMNITEKTDNYQGEFTASVKDDYPGGLNMKSQLPWLFLSERYPLSFHVEALYANILGEPLSTLPGYLSIENSDEVTTYSYTTDTEGYITSCATKTSTPGRSWYRDVKYSYTAN